MLRCAVRRAHEPSGDFAYRAMRAGLTPRPADKDTGLLSGSPHAALPVSSAWPSAGPVPNSPARLPASVRVGHLFQAKLERNACPIVQVDTVYVGPVRREVLCADIEDPLLIC